MSNTYNVPTSERPTNMCDCDHYLRDHAFDGRTLSLTCSQCSCKEYEHSFGKREMVTCSEHGVTYNRYKSDCPRCLNQLRIHDAEVARKNKEREATKPKIGMRESDMKFVKTLSNPAKPEKTQKNSGKPCPECGTIKPVSRSHRLCSQCEKKKAK